MEQFIHLSRRARLVLTLLTLSAAGLFFLSALNIRASMINTLDRMFAKRFDLTVALSRPYELEKVKKAIDNTAGITRYETWLTTETANVRESSTPASDMVNRLGLLLDKSEPDSITSLILGFRR
jgi:hypothetical protein